MTLLRQSQKGATSLFRSGWSGKGMVIRNDLSGRSSGDSGFQEYDRWTNGGMWFDELAYLGPVSVTCQSGRCSRESRVGWSCFSVEFGTEVLS